MPLIPQWRRMGKAKDRADSGASSRPKSARLGIVWTMLVMKNIGLSAIRLRVAQIPSGMPISAPIITLLANSTT